MLRRFRKRAFLLFVTLIAGMALVVSGSEASAASPQSGGVLRMAFYAPATLDPHFGSTQPEDNISRLIYDFFVFFDEDYELELGRGLAESYDVDESGAVWTFAVRRGVTFHNGKELTAKDVKFSFDRLRDPDIGSPIAGTLSNITDISTSDDHTVVFTLEDPNPDFLYDLFAYQAKVVDADNENFNTNWNGTGPFVVENYLPEDRLVLSRNPNYWLRDDQGTQLPYLDGVEYLFLADESSQLEALRGGQVQLLMFLPAEFVPELEANPDIDVHRRASNFSYVLRMRSDEGRPAADNRVRQALKLGTDREEMLIGAAGGLGVTGRDTPIGPAFGAYYLDVPELGRDVEKAKALLAEAGYPDGLDITIHTQRDSPVPAMATIWQQQMADIGVNVNVQLVPTEIYYGDMWMEVDFGFTDWGPRPYPQPYLDLAYVTGGDWSETKYSNPRLDELAAQAGKEIDQQKRAELYHEIQRIFIEEGPIIVPFFLDNLYATRSNIGGVRPSAGMSLDLRLFYFED